jgi:hypothetical protein
MQGTIERVEEKCAEVALGNSQRILVDKRVLPANIHPKDIIEIRCYKDKGREPIELTKKKKGLFG